MRVYHRRPPIDRFLDKVIIVGECHIWTGARDKDGYGIFAASTERKAVKSHRWVWEQHNGPIIGSAVVCHTCDNPACVNINHLFIGSVADNNKDRDNKGRTSRGERHYASKINVKTVLDIKLLAGQNTHKVIAAKVGLSRSHTSAIIAGKKWRAAVQDVESTTLVR